MVGRMTSERKQLLEGLRDVGGTLEPEPGGKAYIGPDDIKKRLHLTCNHVAPLLYRAEKDGLIARDVSGKRTKSITLLADMGPARQRKDPNAPKRPYTKRAVLVPLPAMGEQVTVAMLSQDRDGRVQLGLRSETGSWMVSVEGFAAAEVE